MFENISASRGPMYDPLAVQPMRDELTFVGFEELLTPQSVHDAVANTPGTLFVLLNSVCGCAAGSARPAATEALQHSVIPDRIVTVFAGQERDAVDVMRGYFPGFAPSSPCMAVLRGGKLEFILQRHDIEGRSAEDIATELRAVFDRMCSRQGPSIPAERYAELDHARMCGSKIPRIDG
jgi:putative YphP/YqiW family bacilliredoxin